MIKFCIKLKKTVTEMKFVLDAAYSESAMSQASVYHWYNEYGIDGQTWRIHDSVNQTSNQQ